MFFNHLKTFRNAKGFTQEELAVRMNVVRQTVSKWEQGLSVPDANELIKLVELLEMPIGELLGAKMENVRIYEMPVCKMVSSQCGMFGDENFNKFYEWYSELPKTMWSKDFLWYDTNRNGFVWYYMYDETLTVPSDFEIVDFPGGLYVVATGIDGQTNIDAMNAIKEAFYTKKGFERDNSRAELGNIITSPKTAATLGYSQMDYYTPIKIRIE